LSEPLLGHTLLRLL